MKIEVRTGNIEEVIALSREIPEFVAPYSENEYHKRLRATHIILVAEVLGVPIGFKVGYDRFENGRIFYSWLGGVHPSYRSMGVAKLLLDKMEVWCKLKGFLYLQFATLNRHRAMMHFAVDRGFNVVDFKPDDVIDNSRIYFQKKL